jgi:hypothetical protein
MNVFETDVEDHESPNYRLCPRCMRTVHASSNEHYCINDGSRMLEACPVCSTKIGSPYARYCATCGCEMTGLGRPVLEITGPEIAHQH